MPWPVTGTADAGSDTTSMIDDALSRYPNDRFNGAHILMTSGTHSSDELLITDFLQSTGDCTFIPTLTGDTLDSDTYEILPYSGTDFLRAIQASIMELYDRGLMVREFFVQMMSGSPLYNSDWSYWNAAATVDGWTVSGSTLARERASQNIAVAETAVKLDTATGTLTLNSRYRRYLEDMKGDTIRLYCPVKCDTASAARINLYNGSNNYSPYHGGTSTEWELLMIEVQTDETDNELYPQLVLDDANATAYFGMPFFWGAGGTGTTGGAGVRVYPMPGAIIPERPVDIRRSRVTSWQDDEIASGRATLDVTNFNRLSQVVDFGFRRHHDEDTTTFVALLDFSDTLNPVPAGVRMFVRADSPLTIPTTVTATNNLEVNLTDSLLLATLAAMKLLQRHIARSPASVERKLSVRLGHLTQQFNELTDGAGTERSAAAYALRW